MRKLDILVPQYKEGDEVVNFSEIYNDEKFLAYLDFIKQCSLENPQCGEKHHIIPKCIGGNNKKSNIILLSYENHYKAHKILAESFPNNHGLVAAWHLIHYVNNKEISAEEYEKLRTAYKETCSVYFKKHPNKSALNKIWCNNGEKEIYVDNIDSIPDGFVKGRLRFSDETTHKFSNNASNRAWYNNGIVNRYLDKTSTIPDGFTLGRINIGKWYNNGVVEIQVRDLDKIPDGFTKGRIKPSEETRKRMSLSGRGKKHNMHKNKKVEELKYDK